MQRTLMQIVSWVALAGTILPAVLFLTDRMDLASTKTWMLVATVTWFGVTPWWMGHREEAA